MEFSKVGPGGANVPVVRFESVEDFAPTSEIGAFRFEADTGRNIDLEAMLVNKGSDVLFVVYHGALTRENVVLPRFERLAGFLKTEYSVLFFSDPTLRLGDDLELSWFTGWEGADMRQKTAAWAVRAAEAIGAKHIVFFGGSGGGFAALQASAYAPGSYCVTFNPQTAVNEYLVEGKHMGPQRRYIRYVMPELLPVPIEKLTMEHDWASTAGEVVSAVKTYSRPIDNHVLYIQNSNDFSHMESHYGPFLEVLNSGPNADNFKFEFYEGPHAHVAQPQEVVDKAITAMAAWARSEDYVSALS